MFIYAGIDEAGYGPMFGPLTVGRTVLALPDHPVGTNPPALWQKLRAAVCKNHMGRKGRLVINDSKKVYSPAHGLHHLELGVLAFAALAGRQPSCVATWLDALGETTHRDQAALPWYACDETNPWNPLPVACSGGELAVARNLLSATAKRVGVEVLDIGAAVVFEDRFNRMVAATRSKAATSFTFVAGHLLAVWQQYGQHDPTVVVDRQGGRAYYRELLSQTFPDAQLTIIDENETCSSYRLRETRRNVRVAGIASEEPPLRSMTVSFLVEADAAHMPVALASMVSKYTREILMSRFNAWFTRRAPHIKPTAGYAMDANRFWAEVEPLLPQWGVSPTQLRRLN